MPAGRDEDGRIEIRLEPWAAGDLPLLRRLLGDPAMTAHLGGPESEETLADRQRRFERLGDSGEGRMFKVVDARTGTALGSVGYWRREWRGEGVFEAGWLVLPEFQGHGVAGAATRQAVARAAAERERRFLHAFPAVANAPSNALCRRLGFTLLEELDFAHPPGNILRCNDWRLDLRPPPAAAGPEEPR
jgi:RimJ/RimL family protein N-acetyltransferase